MNEYTLVTVADEQDQVGDATWCTGCLFKVEVPKEDDTGIDENCLNPIANCFGHPTGDSSFTYRLAHKLSGAILTPEDLTELVNHYKEPA